MPDEPNDSAAILARQAARESSARTYPRHLPLVLASGQGVHVTTADGHTYIDCLAGAGSLALGHNHPVTVNALKKVLATGLPLQCLDLATPVRDHFIGTLLDSLPQAFGFEAHVLACGPTGADAVEAALKLVRTATGRRSILTFHGGYHGATAGALSVSSVAVGQGPVTGLPGDVHFFPYPNDYHCRLDVGCSDGAALGLKQIESVLSGSNSGIPSPAGMILEVVQGEGGVIPAPDDWLREIRHITKEHGVPLIVDEIQTGWGRTGCLYAFERSGIVPDVLVLSKAIGGGLPLSVMICQSHLDTWLSGAHIGTFRGNQLGMAVGAATLDFIIENDLPGHAAAMGDLLLRGLQDVQSRTGLIGDVRGRGLMLGAELLEDVAAGQPPGGDGRAALARRVQAASLSRGLIIEMGGRHDRVARFLPPLILEPKDVDAILDRFGDAVEAVERGE